MNVAGWWGDFWCVVVVDFPDLTFYMFLFFLWFGLISFVYN